MENKIPVIKMDVDGFVRNFCKGVYFAIKRTEPENCPEKEPVVEDWDISKYYPKVNDFYKKVFTNPSITAEIFGYGAHQYEDHFYTPAFIKKAFPDALIFFQSHQSNITARRTRFFINQNYSEFDVICHHSSINKSVIPGILIDDKPDNILDNGIGRSILIPRPWNVEFRQQNEDLRIGYNTSDVIKHIEQIIKEAY